MDETTAEEERAHGIAIANATIKACAGDTFRLSTSISAAIEYYSDRWCLWRLVAVETMLAELRQLLEQGVLLDHEEASRA